VLTLQLLERLVVGARIPSVMELQTPHELLQWLETCPKWLAPGEPQAEIGFFDDLSEKLDVVGIDDLVDNVFRRDTPYAGLITCAPTDAYIRFHRASKRLKITRILVSPPDAAEYESFRIWAEQRVGVSLRVPEREVRELSSFILSLKPPNERTGSTKIAEFGQILLAAAANALGFSAPSQLLSEDDLLAFMTSRADVELSPTIDLKGVRLGHGTIIWPLYIEWSSADLAELPARWGRDLARVIACRLNEGEKTEARSILGGLLDRSLIEKRLSRIEGASPDLVLDAAYNELQEICPLAVQAPLYRLWLGASAGKRLKNVDAEQLRRSAQQLLGADQVAPGDAADIAVGLLSGGRKDEAARAADRLLLKSGPQPTALKFMAQALSSGAKGRHADLGRRWLEANIGRREIGAVLVRAITPNASDKVKELGLKYVERFQREAESGPVLWALWLTHRPPKFYRLLDRWLDTASDSKTALLIYIAQLGTGERIRYVARATKWAAQNLAFNGMHELLKRLVESDPLGKDVHDLVDQWLEDNSYSSQATPLLAELVKAAPDDANNVQRALDHLDAGVQGGGYLLHAMRDPLASLGAAEMASLRARLSPRHRALVDLILKSAMPARLPRA